MSFERVVPNIRSERFDESRAFYVGLLGFEVAMDMGWIMTFVSPTNPTAEISIIRSDDTAPVVPQLSVEGADVDVVHAEAVRRGLRIVHPLTDESWGVRRFFVVDPNGVVLNVMAIEEARMASDRVRTSGHRRGEDCGPSGSRGFGACCGAAPDGLQKGSTLGSGIFGRFESRHSRGSK